MNIQLFLEHWGLTDNPFRAEEAKDDPIFQKLIHTGIPHPDFEKIYGDPRRPSPAVVFGEKGSGKTSMRLQIMDRLTRFNAANPKEKIWVISYDELNPTLDHFTHKITALGRKEGHLGEIRLEDHMDAIMSLGVTALVDIVLDKQGDEAMSGGKFRRRLKRMPPQKRLDLAELTLLYDQPIADSPIRRWTKIRQFLGYGAVRWLNVSLAIGTVLTVFALIFAAGIFLFGLVSVQTYVGLGITGVGGVFLLLECFNRRIKAQKLAKKIFREVRMVARPMRLLRDMIGNLPGRGIQEQPLPIEGYHDSRYQLLQRFMSILKELDYAGAMVLFDRIDEPAVIKGDAGRMRSLVWPMLDNKFLQIPNIGVKMLLPLELRHLLRREDASFFQRARLDKQQMIDQLRWSGATLYDLCNQRIVACKGENTGDVSLRTLFDDEVSTQDLIEALDQMHQPRDAFKFLYQVMQEHCMHNSDQVNAWNIPKMTLEHIRREQSQRVQELHRGLTPA